MAVCLFHYGVSIWSKNPVTIYIAVDFTSDETKWLEIINDIKCNINNERWANIYIHIEYNEGFGWTFELLSLLSNKTDYTKRVTLDDLRIKGDYRQLVNLG